MNTREKMAEMLESEEHERRMRVIAQNGNSGLNYEQDMLNGFNKPTEDELDPSYSCTDSRIVADKILKADERKATPVYSGVISYFPLALKEISKASYEGQRQHNPDKPLHWDRSKSGDELDAMMRHLLDHASGDLFDDCGTRHIVKCGWRILAFIQKTMENEK
jgi:hypothetical protein